MAIQTDVVLLEADVFRSANTANEADEEWIALRL
jgi:hypothetical protein